jgi:UDP-N-acetylglucosamine:LPS N-acetylglucosamine transferase
VLWRVPLVVVNIDAVPGLVNRVIGRFAAACAVGFAGTPLPKAEVTGAPVRDDVIELDRSPEGRAAARHALGVPPTGALVAVFGGSLGARRLNVAALELSARWAGRADRALYHVTGRRDWDELGGDAPAEGPSGPAGATRRVPFEERMPLLYAAADLVVCRAGAMSVAELAVAAVPSVLVPLPGAPGDHQTANARALVDAGAAVLLPDAECVGQRLGALVDQLLDDPGRLGRMAAAARPLGHADAAARVAEVVLAHAR